MIFKTLVLIGLLGGNAMAETNLRASKDEMSEGFSEHLDLELEIEGERQLFPLLPGVKCPTGHTCRARNFDYKAAHIHSTAPMVNSLKQNFKTSLAASMNWEEVNSNLNEVVNSGDYCSRRNAMARAAGLMAGLSAASVSKPAYAAETKEVLMGNDSGLLVFVPAKLSICKGDTVKWINNKAGPHNVVFDEDAIPQGVDQESISMSDQLGEPGDTFSMSFSTPGTYEYYCEPHRGAGMQAVLTVA